jgi:hypothetical protein
MRLVIIETRDENGISIDMDRRNCIDVDTNSLDYLVSTTVVPN